METPRRLALSAATAWLGAVLAVAVAAEPPGKDRQPSRPPAVAGQLLVRLRSDFPECAHCLVASGRGLTAATGTRVLDQVRLKHGITAMEPVFGGVHAAERRKAAQQRFGAKGARGGAGTVDRRLSTVDLSQIYLVRVDPKADVLKVAADFRRDPNVVSAEPNYLYSIKSTGDLSPEVNLAPRRKAAKQSTVSEEASPA
ncbi:MAG: hypothetical protein HY699_18035, partial [Deltaproteobacteria bacterium]|nr:hypothetical protein [Deltaproteobacteria bacterium]